jgi:hypothetical protein
MADLSNVTMKDLLNGLGKIVKSDFEGRYVFDVVVFDDDGNEKEKFWIAIEPGKVEWAEGDSGEDGAVPFHIKRGGMETMKAMQIDGLDAAMRFMFDGSIYTSNPGGAQKWFEVFELGEAALQKAVG